MTRYQALAVVAAAGTYLLIVVGAVVRVTGSGLGCPDWPTCHGQLVPPLEPTAIIEYTHRFLGAVVSPLILATTIGAWLVRRRDRAVLVPATLVPVLLAIQIVLGMIVVRRELPAMEVLVHLVFAMAILGLLVWTAIAAGPAPRPRPGATAADAVGARRLVGWAHATTTVIFLLLIVGAYVQATGAGYACVGFPGCNGQALPFGSNHLVDLHLFHRLLAYAVAVLTAVVLWQAWRHWRWLPAVPRTATLLAALIVVQIGIGAVLVSTALPPHARGAHVAGAAAVWAAAVALTCLVARGRRLIPTLRQPGAPRPGAAAPADETPSPVPTPNLASAYLSLTKPRIIVLLLVTTLLPMIVAANGWPPLPLMLATLVGGAMAAAAGNAINCYCDRDIDALMGRTVWRPLPAGVLAPEQALRFGLALAVGAFVVLALGANLLAAVLAEVGFLFYVFVYTRWLKRTSPSNIVIGGAAGAVPPLVGWAAVTGDLSLLPVALFAIVFYWTPPHFWALALLIKEEYEKARVPMLPIVRGEAETRRQILLYSLLLLALTVALYSFHLTGLFYLLAAVALGGLLVYYAARLLREATRAAALRLYKYSLLYLALIFAAVVVDRQVFR